jgi:hypothetical protein
MHAKSARVEFFRSKDDPNQLVGFALETLSGGRSRARASFYRGLVAVELPLLGEELPRDEMAVVDRALAAARQERSELRYLEQST